MPFASKAQERFMFSQHPGMAKEWAAATPSIKALPERKGSALVKASKRRSRRTQLSGPPQARGNTVTGAATSTTRIGY